MTTLYENYLTLSTDEQNTFIACSTDSPEKAEQLYQAMLYECRRLRKREYDNINQFELMYDDQQNNTNTWAAAIEDVKQRFPKPNNPQ